MRDVAAAVLAGRYSRSLAARRHRRVRVIHSDADPVPLLAPVVAAAAEGMRVGTAIVLLTLLNPVEAAENAGTLDAIAAGRFVLGVGIATGRSRTAFGVGQGRGRLFERKHARGEARPPASPVFTALDNQRAMSRENVEIVRAVFEAWNLAPRTWMRI